MRILYLDAGRVHARALGCDSREAVALACVGDIPAARPGEKVDPRIAIPPDQIEALINQDRASFMKMAHDLYDSVLPVMQAIEAKDKDKLLEVSDGIDRACENCHIKYCYATK